MNVFELMATIALDTGPYESSLKRVSKLTGTSEKDITSLAKTYDKQSAKMGDAVEDASKDIVDALKDVDKGQEKAGDGAKKSAKEVIDSWQKADVKLDQIGKNIVSFGKLAVKGFAVVTGAVTAVTGALLGVESATEEYRIAQGKLNTAFEVAGQTTEVAKEVFQEFYKILGDTDTATEASQLLAKLALNQEDYATWTRIAAGVNGTFGDSLPIEGLIESANETARVGQVTGVLADALNWASINEDDFNEKLAACSSEAERNQLIMETLSGEYDSAADAFYRNNDALIANRDAQIRVTDAMSKVGEEVSRIKGELLENLAPALEQTAAAVTGFLESLDSEKIAEFSERVKTLIDNLSPFMDFAAGLVKIVVPTLNTFEEEVRNGEAEMASFSDRTDYANQLMDEGSGKLWAFAQAFLLANDSTITAKKSIDELGTTVEGADTKIENSLSSSESSFSSFETQATKSLSNVGSEFNNLEITASQKMDAAVLIAKQGAIGLMNAMKFTWSLPKIKLPHFSISGTFSLNPPSVPKFGVSWYAKAMKNAMILDGATIFGSMNGNLLGGGEAGREVVAGESHLMDMIKAAVTTSGISAAHEKPAQSITNHFHITVNGTKYDNLSTLAEDLMIEMQFAYERREMAFG